MTSSSIQTALILDCCEAAPDRWEDFRLTPSESRFQEAGKRVLDIIISALGIALLTPLVLGLWVAIRLDSSGPAIFRQQRIGRGEKVFTCFKFRTMQHKADENLHREAIRRLWAGQRLSNCPDSPYKLTDDPRVTRVGHWLRRTSLDELPQLFNVLRGEMSIVGPRPPIPYELENYRPAHLQRLAVKPGITGLWQITGRSSTTFEQMVEIDLAY